MNTTLQGSSDLDYQPISSSTIPSVPSAAAPSDTQDQAARLRALLSSHLSEGGAGSSQATGADRLEALIDMLYSMTAPAATIAPSAVEPSVATNRTQSPIEMEAETPPTPAPVAAPVSETSPVAHFAVPEITEARPEEPQAVQEPPPDHASAQNTPPLETPSAAMETKSELLRDESAATSEPLAVQEPTAFTENPPAETVEAKSPAADVELPPQAAVEILTTPETSLLDAMPRESMTVAGAITFNLATDKSTASLQIPMQPNLSLITFEQRLDEIILKIHLSL